MDAVLTLSAKGQLVIPAQLRQLLGLEPGDQRSLTLGAARPPSQTARTQARRNGPGPP